MAKKKLAGVLVEKRGRGIPTVRPSSIHPIIILPLSMVAYMRRKMPSPHVVASHPRGRGGAGQPLIDTSIHRSIKWYYLLGSVSFHSIPSTHPLHSVPFCHTQSQHGGGQPRGGSSYSVCIVYLSLGGFIIPAGRLIQAQ